MENQGSEKNEVGKKRWGGKGRNQAQDQDDDDDDDDDDDKLRDQLPKHSVPLVSLDFSKNEYSITHLGYMLRAF